jgi:hypothetical protein
MRREDDPRLWDLLGKAETPALSPFFARNVVRQIRNENGRRTNIFSWFDPRKLIPASAVALALMVTLLSTHFPTTDTSADFPETVARIDPQDYDAVADLDDLLATDDDNLWNDNDSSPL